MPRKLMFEGLEGERHKMDRERARKEMRSGGDWKRIIDQARINEIFYQWELMSPEARAFTREMLDEE